MMHGNGMLYLLSVDVLQSLRDDLLYQVRLFLKPHPAFFDLGDRQQILHQIGQPCAIVIDISAHLPNGIAVQFFQIRKQHTGIAGYGGQRCAQISMTIPHG